MKKKNCTNYHTIKQQKEGWGRKLAPQFIYRAIPTTCKQFSFVGFKWEISFLSTIAAF